MLQNYERIEYSMNYNTKSRSGFTLIELLVVIGILAVLAAIAIPAVAGLIDRANVSADLTNANEMTNAIERFTSEYELYCQDIASGMLDINNLDSAQGRVYNVTNAVDRADIENLEKDSDADESTVGRAIYRDTKYPVNAETLKAIIENYTKTSSSTFDPKQSDMHFWYSPDCGVVVVGKASASNSDLNEQIKSGKDAKGNELTDDTKWIDVTIGATLDDASGSGEIIPTGGVYYIGVTGVMPGDYSGATEVLTGNGTDVQFPAKVKAGDVYVYNGYEYRYNMRFNTLDENYNDPYDIDIKWLLANINGWGVRALDMSRSSYPEMLTSVNGKPIKSLSGAFVYCANLTTAPSIPSTVTDVFGIFGVCTKLVSAPAIPSGVKDMDYAFWGCTALTGNVEINANPSTYIDCFSNTEKPIKITGSTSMKQALAETAYNNNVTY